MNGVARERAQTVDALRAAALLGVVVVNAAGYAVFPDAGHIVPPPVPPESMPATVVQWLVAALLEGKAYPLLAFLFGLGFALSLRARHDEAVPHRRRRMARLLAIGLVHGLLLYAGDVLTTYAIAGFILLRWSRRRLRHLLSLLRALFFVALVCIAVQVGLGTLMGSPGGPDPSTLGAVGSWREFFTLNGSRFLGISIAMPLWLPQILVMMLAGLIAGRLRWLTHRRWRVSAGRLARRAVPFGLLLNAALAAWVTQPGAPWQAPPHPGSSLFGLVGPVLSVGFIAWVVAKPGRLAALAPAGRLTLSMYLAASVAMASLLSGAGLAWKLGSVATLAFGLVLYAVLLAASIAAVRTGWRGPLERWLSAR